MTSTNPYHYFIENNLGTKTNDNYGEYYATMLRRSVLSAAIDENPNDLKSQELLLELEFKCGRYEEAARAANSLYDATGKDEFAIKKLRCMILSENFDDAAAFNAQIDLDRRKPLVGDWDAIQMMRDVIFSDFFTKLKERDYERLFFLKPLLRKFGRHLKFLSYSLLDCFFWDLIIFAKKQVEDAGATFHYISCSDLYSVKNKTKTEHLLLERVTQSLDSKKSENRISWLQGNPDHMKQMHKNLEHYNSDYVAQICAGPKNIIQTVKLVMADWESNYLNVRNGKRVTTDQPEEYNNRVIVLGASDTFGFGSEDAYTFCSFLQRKINEAGLDKIYCVENHGIRGCTLPFSVSNLHQTKISEGDIVVVVGYPPLEEKKAGALGIKHTHIDFSRPHNYGEIFIDHTHFGWTGNKAISDIIYAHVFETEHKQSIQTVSEKSLSAATRCVEFTKYLLYRRTYLSVEESSMQEYLDYLDNERMNTSGRVGSVAVNCNPMTNGHLFLLEHAARSCDFLYVFVIEEDKSYFKFWERLKIVTEGLAHLKNVKVIRGGRYICTDITFPEYSSKEDSNNLTADASMEAWFFCEFIAPRLDIEIIFLGQEPTCQITQQYNAQMEDILPRFDVQVEIIDRIEHAGKTISASLVRKYLEEQRFDLIGQIVPSAALDHMIEYHSKP